MGKYLSSDRHWVDSFSESTEKERPTAKDASSIRQRIEAILSPLKSQWDEENFAGAPAGDLTDQLDRVGDELKGLIAKAREPRLEIEGLVSAAKKDGKPGTRTLEEAIQFYAADDAKTRTDEESRIRTKVRKEYAEKQAVLIEEAERKRQENALRLAAAKSAAETRAAEAKASAIEQDTEHAELVKQAKSRETRLLLAFFMKPGFRQPDGSLSTDKMPISLSKLRSTGALEDSTQGLERLRAIVTDPSDEARPIHKELSGNVMATSHIDKLRKMQNALNELGDVMVELKMLAE